MDIISQLLRLLGLLFLGLSSACAPQTPVPVYWTATPEVTTTAVMATEAVVVPTEIPATILPTVPAAATSEPILATNTAAIPTNTQAAVAVAPTLTPVPPTATVVSAESSILTAGATWQGPVVSGEVSPPPTFPVAAPTTSPISGSPTITPTVPDLPLRPYLPDLNPNDIGVQLDINLSLQDWQAAMGDIERLGIKWVKVQLSWRDMQPDGPNQKNDEFFLRVEQYLEDAANRGLNVLISVAKAPQWARSVHLEDGPPDNPQDLANFITLIFQEINADLFRPVIGDYIDAVEIWNEPNLLREWQGTLPFSGSGYMQLFGPAYQAVRAYSPTIPVLTAGLAPTTTSSFSIDDGEFLRQIYGAGLMNYPDAILGVHPYPWGNPPDARCCDNVEGQGWDDNPHFFFADTLDTYRQIMREHNDSRQMWITEFGYASWDGYPTAPPASDDWILYTDRLEQGVNTIRALQIAQNSPDIGVTILWNLNFATLAGMVQNSDERAAYSMLIPGDGCVLDLNSTNRTERPVYWMVYDAVRPEVSLSDYCGVIPAPMQ
ncbi:MAG: cellulase family glycosylhydrolase [Anaerolineae bacterium]|nr:cellulase family glycosylhydrolase [Anaerolineae bacterium]